MKQIVTCIIVFLIILSCVPTHNNSITIAAASSLRSVLQEMSSQFKVETDVAINIVTGSSGKLAAQIEAGAPYDIFLSANTIYTDYLQNKLSLNNKPVIFAHGQLAFLSNAYLDIDTTSLKSIINNNYFQKIAIPNPKLAPYGQAANDVLNKLNIVEEVEHKLVFAENVSQTNQFLKTEGVNAGFTSVSSVKIKNFSEGYRVYAIDSKLHKPIINSLLIVSKKKDEDYNVQKFITFMKTSKAKSILKKYGYTIPE